MNNLKPKYIISDESVKLHISAGNSKIGKGVYNFSTLPGNAENLLTLKDGTLLTNIPGTCSKHCVGCFNGGCYAVNSALLHNNVVIKAWGDNTLLLRQGTLWGQLDNYVSQHKDKIKLFRINVSGEAESVKDFEEWNKIALRNPSIAFGMYTKNFEDLDKFMQKHGDTAPNFCINISQWNHVADAFLAKYPNKFNVFEYNPTNLRDCDWSLAERARLAKLTKCPAVDIHGHHTKKADGTPLTCKDCGRCYRKTGQITAVYAH